MIVWSALELGLTVYWEGLGVSSREWIRDWSFPFFFLLEMRAYLYWAVDGEWELTRFR